MRHFRLKQTEIAQRLLQTRPGINAHGPVGSLRCVDAWTRLERSRLKVSMDLIMCLFNFQF